MVLHLRLLLLLRGGRQRSHGIGLGPAECRTHRASALTWLSNLASRSLIFLFHGGGWGVGALLGVLLDTFGEAGCVGPHGRHHLGVEQNIHIVLDGRDLESSNARQNIVVGVVVVFIGDQLAVNLFFIPGFGHSVHDAVGIGHVCLDGCSNICEKLSIFAFVVASIPEMRGALRANFKYKC